mgnify:CR=1 FL=1
MIIAKGDDLEERKRLLMDNAHCLLVCPGGVGTFDEFWDCVSHRSLDMKGLAGKPIIVLNVDGYYDGFVMQLRRATQESLLYNRTEEYFSVANSPAQAVALAEAEVGASRRGEMGSAWRNAMGAQRKAAAANSRHEGDDKVPAPGRNSDSFLSPFTLAKSLLFWTAAAESGKTDPMRQRERQGVFVAGACWGISAALIAVYFGMLPSAKRSGEQ